MGMAHFHIKKKKGRPYLYVREIARVDGKPKVISQIYIGAPERVAELVSGQGDNVSHLKVEEFGALWLAQQIDKDIDIAGIIDDVIPRADRETGPSIGEYFLYCIFNRMVEAVSKNQLAKWYQRTAIQHIRPVDLDELTSKRYWEKWDRIDEKTLQKISRAFFERLWELESPKSDCLLFDTTNYYTFMASQTPSALARRGKNKAGRHYLRQIGLGLLVARNSQLPLYYSVYPGNLHDSKHFEAIMDEMFGIVCGLNDTKQRLTVVIDKGMNAEDNFAWIDAHARIHFITTYSTYFAQELATIDLDHFEPVDSQHENGEDRLLAYRTKGEYWGKERAVIVTFNPKTARKQLYAFESKIETLRQDLLAMRAKIRADAPQWRDPEVIKGRYLKRCQQLYISPEFYNLTFNQSENGLQMRFRKDPYQVNRKQAMLGKNIIITDNMDWSTREIVEASTDRWQVEKRFRDCNNHELVGMRPIRHWTDSKIRCHLFTCVVAMSYLRRIELRLAEKGINRTAEDVMNDMRHLHYVLTLKTKDRKPTRRLETPGKTQAEVLSAFNHRVDAGGVLQPVTA